MVMAICAINGISRIESRTVISQGFKYKNAINIKIGLLSFVFSNVLIVITRMLLANDGV